MAVAHDFASESHTGAVGSISEASFTWSHNPGVAPKGVLVFVANLVSASDIVSSVTYGGVEIPAVTGGAAADTATELLYMKAYFLGAGIPTTDPADVVVNRTNNTDELWAVCITIDAAAGKDLAALGVVLLQENGTLAEQSVDDGSPGTNSLRYAAGASGLGAFPPTGANSTALFDFDTGNQTAAVVRETTAGQGARSVGFTSGTSDDRAFVHLAIKEVAAPTTFNQSLSVTSTVTPTMVRVAGKVLSVTSSLTGTMARAVAKLVSLTASITPSVTKSTGKPFSVTSAITASLTAFRQYLQSLSVTSTGTATAVREVGKVASVTSTGTPTLSRSTGKSLSATSSLTPAVLKATAKPLSATATGTATMSRVMSLALGLTVTGTATLVKALSFALTLAATATGTASMARSVGKAVSATASLTGGLVANFVDGGGVIFNQVLSVTVTGTATVTKGISKSLSVTSSVAGSVAKGIAKTLSAVGSVVASLVALFTPAPSPRVVSVSGSYVLTVASVSGSYVNPLSLAGSYVLSQETAGSYGYPLSLAGEYQPAQTVAGSV